MGHSLTQWLGGTFSGVTMAWVVCASPGKRQAGEESHPPTSPRSASPTANQPQAEADAITRLWNWLLEVATTTVSLAGTSMGSTEGGAGDGSTRRRRKKRAHKVRQLRDDDDDEDTAAVSRTPPRSPNPAADESPRRRKAGSGKRSPAPSPRREEDSAAVSPRLKTPPGSPGRAAGSGSQLSPRSPKRGTGEGDGTAAVARRSKTPPGSPTRAVESPGRAAGKRNPRSPRRGEGDDTAAVSPRLRTPPASPGHISGKRSPAERRGKSRSGVPVELVMEAEEGQSR